MFDLTAKAVAVLRELMEPESQALRLSATSGGCAGVRYGMAIDDHVGAGDAVYMRDGLRIVVDGASEKLLTGAVIDFVEAADGGGFVFDNPALAGRCSCSKASC